MKTKNVITATLIVAVIFLFSANGFAQKSTKEIKINTSAQCGMCKDRIEGALAYETGVKKSSLDLQTKVLTVAYNPAKTDETKIKKALNNIGYDADETQANAEAYAKLPACCKKKEGTHTNCKH